MVCYGLGSGTTQEREPGRWSGPTREARHHCWGGQEVGGGPPLESLSLHMCGLSEDGVPLVQATGGKKPLSWAMGDWVLLVQAMGGQVPLLWAKGIRGLSVMWCLLHNIQVAGTECSGHLRG